MALMVDRDTRRKLARPRTATLFGVDLHNAKEEAFCIMVCDGLAIGAAYVRAGFNSKATSAPYDLFHKPHIQARANAILEARRTQGVVTLPEVTDMLKRVFAGALHDAEYSAAHNAAFSLARLYGHVTDKATLEIVRRPSRDPDAPSEQALASWVADLPGLSGPGPSSGPIDGPRPIDGQFLRILDAPAAPLEHQTPTPEPQSPNDINDLDSSEASFSPRPGPWALSPDGDLLCNINDLDGRPTPGQSENGAPTRPVTGTPTARAHSEVLARAHSGLLGDEGTPHPGGNGNGAPLQNKQVPVLTGEFPPIEDLF